MTLEIEPDRDRAELIRQIVKSFNISNGMGIARLILLVLSFFSIFVVGYIHQLGGYTYPLVSGTLVNRIWWDFYGGFITASVVAISVFVTLCLGLAIFRYCFTSSAQSAQSGLPDWVVLIPAITFCMTGIHLGARSEPSLPIMGSLTYVSLVCLLLLGVYGPKTENPRFNSLLAVFQTPAFITNCFALLIMTVALSMGSAAAKDVLNTQATCLRFPGAKSSELVSIIDLRSNGIVIANRSSDHSTPYPLFLPMQQIELLRFGSDLGNLGCILDTN